jgi:hypothetical protein
VVEYDDKMPLIAGIDSINAADAPPAGDCKSDHDDELLQDVHKIGQLAHRSVAGSLYSE